MLGAVIGDVVGSVYEFRNTKDYDFKMFSPESDFTDDTIMTMAVAQWAMCDKRFSHERLEKTMVDFAQRHPHPKGSYGGGFKTWLFHPEMLHNYQTEKNTHTRMPYHSWGNGSAMRVSAIGWLFDSIEMTELVAGISAAITHDHPEGIKGAEAVAAAVFMARQKQSKQAIKEYIAKRFDYDLSRGWDFLHRTYSWDSSCQGTVPEAIIAFLESTDFEDAIRKAISLGGDSDTLACITGAIAEAYYQEIPDYMIRSVLALLSPDLLAVLNDFRKTAYGACYSKYLSSPISSTKEYTPERIETLEPNEIFVFGSNLEGYHGGGAARLAHKRFGAEWGIGVGLTGQCYAIPTMQGGVETIQPYVSAFIRFATAHPEYTFLVTKIGCGIAGFLEIEIAPLFKKALTVRNIVLPKSFLKILSD